MQGKADAIKALDCVRSYVLPLLAYKLNKQILKPQPPGITLNINPISSLGLITQFEPVISPMDKND